MRLGAEPKKVAMLAGIVAVGVAALFIGDDGRPSESAVSNRAPSSRPPTPEAGPRTPPSAARRQTPSRAARNAAVQEFKPVLRSGREEDRIDPTTIDPTLRLDLVRRLANVKIEGGNRTIFAFGTPPAPKQPDPPKIIPGPPPPPPEAVAGGAPPPPAAQPQPAPIRLKFYGFVGGARSPRKRAFFLDGEDIFVASEGDVIQQRYKVVRIGLNSVVMQDLESSNEQTLTLEEPQS